MLQELALIAAKLPNRAIVAVDGVDGAGKTTFADHLKPLIEAQGRPVFRASVDGFHNPRAIRYRRGKSDPLGYFLDSYTYTNLKTHLLDPFSNGAETVTTKCFEHRLDSPDVVVERAEKTALLVLDGIFLHRDDLWTCWDFSLYLNVRFDVSFQRMAQHDGTDPDPSADSNRRYREGQLIYLETCRPLERASRVITG